MKKLMIALGAVAMAACVQAATATWNVTLVNYSPAAPYVDDTTATKYVAYLVDQSYANYDSVADLVAALQKNGSGANGVMKTLNGADAYNASSQTHTVKFASGTAAALDNEPQTYEKGMGIEAYTVIFDASDPAKAKNYMVAYKEEIKFNNSLNLSASFTNQAGNEWVSVPEPTSGLLLLLGVAGLALRRRRA